MEKLRPKESVNTRKIINENTNTNTVQETVYKVDSCSLHQCLNARELKQHAVQF